MSLPVKEQYSLLKHNSLGIPATSSSYLEAKDIGQLRLAVEAVEEKKQSILVLGEGTNIVFASDFEGLVLRPVLTGIEILGETEQGARVKVAAGENWHNFVTWTLDKGLYGLENLALIPGSCGAAPVQNIGAYGIELSKFLVSVEYFDLESRTLKLLEKDECHFGYRDSIFKHSLFDRAIITSVCMDLSKIPDPCLDYPALSDYLKNSKLDATPENIFTAVVDIRSSKLPNVEDIPNAGSFFKNPVLERDEFEQIQKEHKLLPGYPLEDGEVKIPAGWLIENLGWKGKMKNGVGIYSKQALVVINPGHRKGEKIMKLASEIHKDVVDKFGISLEVEPRIVC